jgi:hypothetical protein
MHRVAMAVQTGTIALQHIAIRNAEAHNCNVGDRDRTVGRCNANVKACIKRYKVKNLNKYKSFQSHSLKQNMMQVESEIFACKENLRRN